MDCCLVIGQRVGRADPGERDLPRATEHRAAAAAAAASFTLRPPCPSLPYPTPLHLSPISPPPPCCCLRRPSDITAFIDRLDVASESCVLFCSVEMMQMAIARGTGVTSFVSVLVAERKKKTKQKDESAGSPH